MTRLNLALSVATSPTSTRLRPTRLPRSLGDLVRDCGSFRVERDPCDGHAVHSRGPTGSRGCGFTISQGASSCRPYSSTVAIGPLPAVATGLVESTDEPLSRLAQEMAMT